MNKNNILKMVGGGIVGIAGHHYGSKKIETLEQKIWGNTADIASSTEQVVTTENCKEYFKEVFNVLSVVISDVKSIKEKKIYDKDSYLFSKVNGKLDELQEEGQSLLDILTTKVDPENQGLEIAKRIVSGFKELEDLLNEIKKDGNNFISDFNFIWDFDLNKFYSYLDTLSLHQEGALFNILVLLTMLVTLFSVLGIFFGNEIIKYFDLENKFPRLSTFFKVRTKLQRYYLMWNLFLLFSLCIVGICMNLLAFVVG